EPCDVRLPYVVAEIAGCRSVAQLNSSGARLRDGAIEAIELPLASLEAGARLEQLVFQAIERLEVLFHQQRSNLLLERDDRIDEGVGPGLRLRGGVRRPVRAGHDGDERND